jgi:hypothetical protein
MTVFSRLLSLLHGGKDGKITETKAEVEQKPTKEQIMDVVGRFKLNAADRLFVKPEDEPTIAFLERLGLLKTESEFSLSPKTGQIEQRRFARWLSWNCEDCVNYFVGDLREKVSLAGGERVFHGVRQCEKGFSLQFTDPRKGKRCPFFEDKRLMEALNGVN